MLTEPDGRPDGRFLQYLQQPNTYKACDPVLFDWLTRVVGENQRRTAEIENSDILGPRGSVRFKSTILTGNADQRGDYFIDCANRFQGCDLIFFDPDNGLEVQSVPQGHRGSRKYVYWDEVGNTFENKSSVLIYQHFPRENREMFITRMATELQRRTQAAAVFYFRTPRVLFLLASRKEHADGFQKQLGAIQLSWQRSRLIAARHV